MQATLDIDDDIFRAINELARDRNVSPGLILSDLARKALIGVVPDDQHYHNGFALFPRGNRVVTAQEVQEMIDELD